MSETKIIGDILLLNEVGDSVRLIDAPQKEVTTIGGTFGSLIIDRLADPPKIQGKGNVWIQEESNLVRTTRILPGITLTIYISTNGKDGRSIGSISHKQ